MLAHCHIVMSHDSLRHLASVHLILLGLLVLTHFLHVEPTGSRSQKLFKHPRSISFLQDDHLSLTPFYCRGTNMFHKSTRKQTIKPGGPVLFPDCQIPLLCRTKAGGLEHTDGFKLNLLVQTTNVSTHTVSSSESSGH